MDVWQDDGDAMQIVCDKCGERHDVGLGIISLPADIAQILSDNSWELYARPDGDTPPLQQDLSQTPPWLDPIKLAHSAGMLEATNRLRRGGGLLYHLLNEIESDAKMRIAAPLPPLEAS